MVASSSGVAQPADPIRDVTLRWVERAVVGLQLCPFAEAPLRSGAIAVATSTALDEDALLADVEEQCAALLAQSSDDVATVLVAAPNLRANFADFQDGLGALEDEDVFAQAFPAFADQIMVVCFHPEHQWAGLATDDPVNFEKRSPFVIVNLLRTSMVDAAIATGRTVGIGERNEARLRKTGIEAMRTMYAGLFAADPPPSPQRT